MISSILDGEDEEVEESIDLASFASKEDRDLRTVVQRLSNEERANLVKQLESADSLEEIERIESQLRGE